MATAGFSVVNMANAVLNGVRHVPFDINGTTTKLHVGIPGDDGTDNYCQGDTSAEATTFGAASGGAIALSNSPSWTNGGYDEQLTHISVWTSTTFLWSAALTTPRDWSETDTFTLSTLGISLSPLAAD